MPPGRFYASNLFLVYPLLDRREADPQFDGSVVQSQQFFVVPFRFIALSHRDAIVATTKFAVKSSGQTFKLEVPVKLAQIVHF